MSKIKTNKYKKYFSPGSSRTILMVLLFFVIVAIISAIFLFFKIKTVYVGVSSGRQDLSHAIYLVGKGDFVEAQKASERASSNFIAASEVLQDLQENFFIKRIKILNNNINDFKKLSQMAEILSRSAGKALFLMQDINDVFLGKTAGNFLELTETERIRVLKTLYESYPEMQGIKANINLSLFYLNQIEDNKLLAGYASEFSNFKKNLTDISLGLEKTIALAGIIPVLSGYPDPVSYLVVLQNNHELRPTGGFIGSYGVLELKAGDISKLETHDIYHLDMPASVNKSFNVSPPLAIKKYLGTDKWFMRDANWSPDWPSSAKNLQWFYKEEMTSAGKASEINNFSGVVAIVPEFITDLLYIVGPIKVGDKTYDKDNFIEVLQYEVEMAFREDGVSEWDRKLVIGDILKELKTKLFNLPSDRWPELVEVFNKNIAEKNILVYLNDDYSRQISSDLKWGGQLQKSPSDYFMVVDANLAAYKTDRVMEKKIKYYLTEEGDQLKAKIEISYKNNGWFDWQTTRYRSFTRIYVPQNSTLLSSFGSLDKTEVDQEKNIENPKTYFTGFISVEPKEIKTLTFEYYLPASVLENIKKNNYYSLLIQKQPGNNVSQVEVYLNFSKAVKVISTEGESQINSNKVYFNSPLDKDYKLDISF